ADTAERRTRREAFVEELLATVAIYPLTTDTAKLAGKLDAEQQSRGILVPFADLLIGATALSVGYFVLTVNGRRIHVHSELLVVARTPLVGRGGRRERGADQLDRKSWR